MGADIHDYYETRCHSRWRWVGAIFPNRWYNPDQPEDEYNCPLVPSLCYRDYRLFSILADVRNSYGIKCICEPKGFPLDASPEGMDAYSHRVVDGKPDEEKNEISREDATNGRVTWLNRDRVVFSDWHTPSWLTLRQLLAYNWAESLTLFCLVGAKEYQEFKSKGKPSSWSFVAHPDMLRHLTNEEMEKRIAEGTATQECKTILKWEKSLSSWAEEFVLLVLPRLLAIAAGGEHPDATALLQSILAGDKLALAALNDWLLDRGCLSLHDVRMVFWFDS